MIYNYRHVPCIPLWYLDRCDQCVTDLLLTTGYAFRYLHSIFTAYVYFKTVLKTRLWWLGRRLGSNLDSSYVKHIARHCHPWEANGAFNQFVLTVQTCNACRTSGFQMKGFPTFRHIGQLTLVLLLFTWTLCISGWIKPLQSLKFSLLTPYKRWYTHDVPECQCLITKWHISCHWFYITMTARKSKSQITV